MSIPKLTYDNLQSRLDYYSSLDFHAEILFDIQENLECYSNAGLISEDEFELYDNNFECYCSSADFDEFEDEYYSLYRRRIDSLLWMLYLRTKELIETCNSKDPKIVESFVSKVQDSWEKICLESLDAELEYSDRQNMYIPY